MYIHVYRKVAVTCMLILDLSSAVCVDNRARAFLKGHGHSLSIYMYIVP